MTTQMLLSYLLLVALWVCPPSMLTPSAQGSRPDPSRQFDFWVGEWSVQNRDLMPDGTWVDKDVTKARITPVCGGHAILEEWAGPLRGSFMNGFSLRAWNAPKDQWDLVLNWTVDGNAGFGLLAGKFRHGRGEFFSGLGGPQWTRYTFSDPLPTTVRWDSATSRDSGLTWNTSWIMEFTRTRPALEVTQNLLFEEDWNAGSLSPHAAARELDGALGAWAGTRTLSAGTQQEARLRTRLLNKDCLVLDVFEWRDSGAEDWNERLSVHAWVQQAKRWETWRLSESDPILRQAAANSDGSAFLTSWVDQEGTEHQEVLVQLDPSHLMIEESVVLAGGDLEMVAITELSKLVR